jgi:predicted ATPase/class 3 adenylate cyclase
MTEEPAFPTGTVTFLFTDIEGSTQLGRALGPERYGALLERHRALLRGAFAAAGGVEVGTEGDSFFVVFERPSVGLAAAADGQRALHSEPWPADGRIRVRMGLHTGEGILAAGTYVGNDVNRAARIAAAGHGGQVLVSETTRALAADMLPAGTALRELGEHRLKDLRPERLFELTLDGIPGDFPAIRSLDAQPNNLPTQLTSFVGRETELAETRDLLADTRLLTLTGPGGTGKTRLSLQLAASVADRFPDGVWFVALEPIREAALVAPTIGRVLGVTDSASRPALELLTEHVGVRQMLLVLDNFEQVIGAAPVLAQLLRACPNLTATVTSRAPLHVSGEQEYPVPGLPTPPDMGHLSSVEIAQLPAAARRLDPEALSHYEAVRLFIARAVAVRPGFQVTNENAPAVAAICARLQGMPLAIELAAARVKLLPPEAILRRLEHQLELLASTARDLTERQQTLRGAIAWSYDLLGPGERRLLGRLSVFMGGCDLTAAERVCGPGDELGLDVFEGIAGLVDQSLVRSDDAGPEARFSMLDTIRTFAAERLAADGESAEIRRRHALAFLDLAEDAAPRLAGGEQRTWLDRLDRDHDNIRAALDWAAATPEPAVAIRLAFAMWRFWQKRGHLNEARVRLDGLIAQPWSHDDPILRARLCEARGGVAYWQADTEGAPRCYAEALALWRSIGDQREIANALYNDAFMKIMPGFSGDEAAVPGGLAEMDEALALFRSVRDPVGAGNVTWALGSHHYFRGAPEAALPFFREALEQFRLAGDRTMEAWALKMLGSAELKLGRLDEAREALRHSLRHFHEASDTAGITIVFDDLSSTAVADGDLPRAARLRGAARALQATTGTTLARFVDETFEQGTRPSARQAMGPDELARHEAEGRAMTLDAAVAYALDVPLSQLAARHDPEAGQ